jgi:ATP-dependent protease ClpP protease subunit
MPLTKKNSHTSKNNSNSGITKDSKAKSAANTNVNTTTTTTATTDTASKTDEKIVDAVASMPIIPKLVAASRMVKTKKNTKTVELQLENIEQYIYSNRFSHIYLYDDINNNSVLEVREAIDYANKSSGDDNIKTSPKGIVLHINSPGGSVTAGIGLMRIVSRSRVPIIVYIEGLSASAATFVSVLAKYRVMAPHASFLIHQYWTVNMGKHEELEFQVRDNNKMFGLLKALYLRHTKIPEKYLDEILSHDLLLTPQLALQYGLIDKILKPIEPEYIEKYFSVNPEYDLSKHVLDVKTNLNSIYLYGSFEMGNAFRVPLDVVSKICNILQKQAPFLSSNAKNANINHIITKGGAKPIVFHVSDLGQFNNIFHILPIVNILSLSLVPTISIIDGPMSAMCLLFTIVCHKRYIYQYSYVSMDFVHFSDVNLKLADTLYNTKMFLGMILELLRKYTQLPDDIMKNIFKKRYIFSANQCIQYGLCDGIMRE